MNEVKHGNNRFYIGEEQQPLAEMTYVPSGSHLLIIDHTEVSETLKGQGAGRQLLDTLVDWARTQEKKIIPLCPYAKAQMEKHAIYHDMIHR